MDGFFGIGFGELILVAIIALIILGPERLPSALREVAKFIRYLRNLSREFTDQFGDEFKALEDLNPRRILQDAISSIDEEEKAKEEAPPKKPAASTPAKTTPAKTNTTTTAKPATTGTKTTTASTPKPRPVTPQAADSSKTVARDSTTTPAKTNTSTPDESNTPPTAADSEVPSLSEAAPENRIAPPQLEAKAVEDAASSAVELSNPARLNGHHTESKAADEPNPAVMMPAVTTVNGEEPRER